ncbi:MAG: hypothetical protein C4K47_02630 [Candidatus Thorarchaeota archaeon]|nr:MAG: hypothetical protein C4K47_02630 [Candidatus Thorarchaeota archaeon]
MTEGEFAGRIRRVLASSDELLAFKGFVTEMETAYPAPAERLIPAFTLMTGDTKYRVSLRNRKPFSLETGHEVWLAGVQDPSGLIEPRTIVDLDTRMVMLPYDISPKVESLARTLYRLQWAILATFILGVIVSWSGVLYSLPTLSTMILIGLTMAPLLLFPIVVFQLWKRRARVVYCDNADWPELLELTRGCGSGN